MSARPIGELVAVIVGRANNLVLLNDFLGRIDDPCLRKRAIMALWEAEVISVGAAELLIEYHMLEAA